MSDQMGHEGQLYVKNNGDWIEIDLARDVTMELERSEVDRTSRANDGWRARRTGLAQWGANADVIWDPSNTGFNALRTAFLNDDEIEVRIFDAEGHGLEGSAFVQTFTRNEPLDDVMTASAVILGASAAEWVEGTS